MTDKNNQPIGIDDARLDTIISGGILTALLLPAVQKATPGTDDGATRSSGTTTRCANNLKQTG